MEINIYDAKTNFSKLIQLLIDQCEDSICICKNGVPVVEMRLIKKTSKRVGLAKGQWDNFSMDMLDSVDVSNDFYVEK